jgi:3-deoxy-D-manno-octulosonate 8-phosphate phosphatase (KDO 8-P phosphatase)
MEDITIREKAARIKMLVLDVDGTLTDGGVYIDANGVQSKKFSIRDGMGITLLREKGIEVGFLSHSRSGSIVEERARMLSIQHVYAGREPKANVLHRWMNSLSLQFDEIAYIGDDVVDIEVMRSVGLSACPADAHHSVIQIADIVLNKKGGDGCVREFIDRYLLAFSF